MKKYELLAREGSGLRRVKALKDFGDVKKGDIGGYVEKEDNLSHSGNAWVYGNARVYGNAWVYRNARVYGNAEVYDDARIYGNARVYGNAEVDGNARVFEDAKVFGNTWIHENSEVYGNADVCGNAFVCGEADVYGDVCINGGCVIGEVCEKYESILFIQTSTRLITIYKDLEGVQRCNIGCQKGITLEQLEERIQEDGGMKPHRQAYLNLMKQIKL